MDRVVLVTKATRLEELIVQHLTHGAARFSLESQGQSIEPYVAEDAAHRSAIAHIRKQIPNDVLTTSVTRENLPNFLFRDNDLVIVCGPDGLFANVAKYLTDQPVLTVNPDPNTVAGVLMLFHPKMVGEIIAKVREGKHCVERLPFVKAAFDDGRTLWGINDIFIGRKDQVSARYRVTYGSQEENQSSSGIIVSTGVGSTGWIRSIQAMVAGLNRDGGGSKILPPSPASNRLLFVVREPFPSPTTGTSIVTGAVLPNAPLLVTSQMPEGGFLFSDGIIERAEEWGAGSTVTVSVGDRFVSRIIS
ncbi:MAG: NrtR-regulated hypothetical OrfY [Parcubacteria bacterium C7867-001]|nr:MAG: NrtR-regulated hypothetical OrfY [Parcubacteria bacterium C7867-001]